VAYGDNPRHRRARLLRLTTLGRSTLGEIQAAQRPWADHLGGTVGEARLRRLNADLDRVLDALVENALHYGNGEVLLRSAPGAVEVLDRGPGLADDEVAAVFERFHRGRAGRAGPSGTGLGLPIARELARRWGGEVTLANRVDGAGAVAVVTVPSLETRPTAAG
jgi:signal transduction histidine kinase